VLPSNVAACQQALNGRPLAHVLQVLEEASEALVVGLAHEAARHDLRLAPPIMGVVHPYALVIVAESLRGVPAPPGVVMVSPPEVRRNAEGRKVKAALVEDGPVPQYNAANNTRIIKAEAP
jgi:hypothetical protein